MKSKGYRVVAAFGILAAIGAIGFGVWSMANNTGTLLSGAFSSGEKTSDSMEVSSASSIEFDGYWDINLTSGKPSLSLTGNKDQLKSIKFSQNNGILTLKQHGMNLGQAIKVEMTMPDITDVQFQGAGSLNISGYQLKGLKLMVKGGTSVIMSDTIIETLELTSEGASNVDLTKASITNANVNLRGASNAMINMNGGSLGGKIEGVGNLTYSGKVSSENVQTDGLANVEKQ